MKFRDRYEHDPRCEADTTDRWFSTVRTMRTLYNVQDEDLYNFDEYRGDVDKSGHGILLAWGGVTTETAISSTPYIVNLEESR